MTPTAGHRNKRSSLAKQGSLLQNPNSNFKPISQPQFQNSLTQGILDFPPKQKSFPVVFPTAWYRFSKAPGIKRQIARIQAFGARDNQRMLNPNRTSSMFKHKTVWKVLCTCDMSRSFSLNHEIPKAKSLAPRWSIVGKINWLSWNHFAPFAKELETPVLWKRRSVDCLCVCAHVYIDEICILVCYVYFESDYEYYHH